MYIKSVNGTIEDYTRLLQETRNRQLDLPNTDYDTGRETRPGEYPLSDKTYARLVDELSKNTERPPSAALRDNLLHFYSDPNAQLVTKKNAKAWRKLQDELKKLKEEGTAVSLEKSSNPNQ